MLGSIFKKSYDLPSEIELLYSELRDQEATKELVGTKGWESLASWMIYRMSDLSDEIISLSENIEKNKDGIKYRVWTRSIYKHLMEVIGTTLDKEEPNKIKLKQLKEIARIAELD